MQPTSRFTSLVLAAGLISSTAAVATAQPESIAVTPAREAKAIAFARKHHPELAELLSNLKKADAPAFENAIREVSQNTERLEKLRENDAERYELALRVWTLDSRIRLLAARSTMSNDPANESELRGLLSERQVLRLAMFKLDRERLVTRLERLEGQIGQLEADPKTAVENDLARIKREIKAAANRERRAAGGAAAKAPPKADPVGNKSGVRDRKPPAKDNSRDGGR
ncbi:MAG: hypothetical protein M3552_00330 [Planctomycetota bacterium]|nr:hypothetical protein [Planctomycetaceae bacterium]MDQ3329091.1 hypothetical protein [Planctomycetota bacterium]